MDDYKSAAINDIHRLIAEMPIWSTLCVHEAVDTTTEDGVLNNSFSMTQYTHVLEPTKICTEPGHVTQYGPKTPKLAAEIDMILKLISGDSNG